MYCNEPELKLVHNVRKRAKQECIDNMGAQPGREDYYHDIEYCGWLEVPSLYIICEYSKIVPKRVQEQCAGLAASDITRLRTGHIPMIMKPQGVTDCITNYIDGILPGDPEFVRNDEAGKENDPLDEDNAETDEEDFW